MQEYGESGGVELFHGSIKQITNTLLAAIEGQLFPAFPYKTATDQKLIVTVHEVVRGPLRYAKEKPLERPESGTFPRLVWSVDNMQSRQGG